MVVSTEGLATSGALAIAVLDEVLHAVVAEDMAAGFERRVADVGVADGTDGNVLFESELQISWSTKRSKQLTRQSSDPSLLVFSAFLRFIDSNDFFVSSSFTLTCSSSTSA